MYETSGDRLSARHSHPTDALVRRVRHTARMLRAALLAALIVLLAPAAAQAAKVRVYFTKGEQLAYVERDLPAGPTAALARAAGGPDRGRADEGLRHGDPAGMTLTSAKVSGDRVDIDLSARSRPPSPSTTPALAQVVYTATAAPAHRRGARSPARPTRATDFGPEPFTEPKPPTRKLPAPAEPEGRPDASSPRSATCRPSAVTGTYDYRTQQAVIAFQAWSGPGSATASSAR